MPTLGIAIALLALAVAFIVTRLILGRADSLGLMQQPNFRSSHDVPTPAGGGVGIALGGLVAALPTLVMAPMAALPVVLAGGLLAAIGYADDRQPISAKWRLGAHIALTGGVVASLPIELIALRTGTPDIVVLAILTLAGALWVNLYNFMDGIDGLAGGGAVALLGGGALLAVLGQPELVASPLLWWMLGLAAACIGFLAFNWPPARIFMGDAGSTYLGLMTGFFALVTILGGWLSAWQWLILGALFLADSGTTLLHRAIRFERIWEAHRRHGYQILERRFGAHRRVTLLYLGTTILVLLPLAWLAGERPAIASYIVAGTYGVLIAVLLLVGAGRPLERFQEKLETFPVRKRDERGT